MSRRTMFAVFALVAVLAVSAWLVWTRVLQPPLPPLPAAANPDTVMRRYFEELQRGRPDYARALIAPEFARYADVSGLSSDPAFWKGAQISASDGPIQVEWGRQYAPYQQFAGATAHLDQVYREGQSNDYRAGEPVVLYFRLGRKSASSPWRILAVADWPG